MTAHDADVAPPEGQPRSLAKTVFRDGAVYAIAGVLSQGIAFILFPFFAHVFEPRDYGIIDLLGVVMTLVNLTVALEVSQGLGRYFAEATDDDDRRGYVSTALVWTLLCYSLFAGVALVFAAPLTRLVLGDVDPDVMRVAVGAMWCSGLSNLLVDQLRWQLRPLAYAVAAVTTTFVVTATSAIYVLVLDLGVEGAILGQLTGFATGGVVAYALARRLYRPRLDWARLRRMLAYSLPLVPASAGVLLNGYADRVAIQSRMTLGDVGLYGVGYRLSLIVSLTLLGFQGALLPQVLRHHEREGTPLELARVFRLFCALALTVVVLVSTFADEILRVLTRPAYYDAERVVPLVVAAAFFAGMYIFAPGLNIAMRTRVFAVITVVGGLANLGLAFLLVGPLGIRGPALSFIVTQAAAFTALMAASQRHYPAPHPWPRLLTGAAVGAALTAFGWALPSATDDLWALPAKMGIAVLAVAVLGLLLIDRDERDMGRRALSAASARLARRARAPRRGSPPATTPSPPPPSGPSAR